MAQRPGKVDEDEIAGCSPPLVAGLDAVQRGQGDDTKDPADFVCS
jgi:hypothetical protein